MILNLLVILNFFSSGQWSTAESKFPPQYFEGSVAGSKGRLLPCLVEATFSDDLDRLTSRAIFPYPHQSGRSVKSFSLGPYVARFQIQRSIFRYQDLAPGALVRDLVVNVGSPERTPTRYAVLYWHAEERHHDPIVCKDLKRKTTPQEVREAEDAFSDFDGLRP